MTGGQRKIAKAGLQGFAAGLTGCLALVLASEGHPWGAAGEGALCLMNVLFLLAAYFIEGESAL